MKHNKDYYSPMDVAEKVRAACIRAACEGFQEASMSGLCIEGASEAAIGAMQSLDLEKVVKEQDDKSAK